MPSFAGSESAQASLHLQVADRVRLVQHLQAPVVALAVEANELRVAQHAVHVLVVIVEVLLVDLMFADCIIPLEAPIVPMAPIPAHFLPRLVVPTVTVVLFVAETRGVASLAIDPLVLVLLDALVSLVSIVSLVALVIAFVIALVVALVALVAVLFLGQYALTAQQGSHHQQVQHSSAGVNRHGTTPLIDVGRC